MKIIYFIESYTKFNKKGNITNIHSNIDFIRQQQVIQTISTNDFSDQYYQFKNNKCNFDINNILSNVILS